MYATAAWQPTDRSRELARVIEEASRRLRFNRDEFADQMGLTAKQLSDQLTQKQPLNLWRLANVKGYLRKLLEVLAEEEGLLILERRLVKLIVHVEETPKPMASLDTYPQQERRRA